MNSLIPSIAELKGQARELKKQLNIPHSKALDLIAQQYKFSNWKHCLNVTNESIEQVPIGGTTKFYISFNDWLKKHKNRDSPLGDLATDALRDKNWPSYDAPAPYIDYLHSMHEVYGAVAALQRGWKSYLAFLKRKNAPQPVKKAAIRKKPVDTDPRRVVYIKGTSEIPFKKRDVEQFKPDDKAWISYDGSKALPVTILEVDDTHYTLEIERPLKMAKGTSSLYLDEVRSTPELA